MNRIIRIVLFIIGIIFLFLLIINICDYVSVMGLEVLKNHHIYINNTRGIKDIDGWISYYKDKSSYFYSYNMFKIPKVWMIFIIIIHLIISLFSILFLYIILYPIIFLYDNMDILSILICISFISCCFCYFYRNNRYFPEEIPKVDDKI